MGGVARGRGPESASIEDPAIRPLHTGFLEWAERTPEAPALAIDGRTWTYGVLDETARRWAGVLSEISAGPPERIGVFGARSEVAYAGTLAALLSGAAFVPLSPRFPLERTRTMIAVSDLDAVVAEGASLPLLEEALAGIASPPAVVVPDARVPRGLASTRTRDAADLERASPLADPVFPSTDSVAYLLFTSGSTGTPKGVPITHRNVSHFLGEALRRYDLDPDDRLTQTFELTFDLSVFDLFVAWGSGACACVPRPAELLSPFRFVREQRVTVWFSVPSVANLIRQAGLLTPSSLPSLRWSLFCGEALTRETAEAWAAAAPNAVLENLYGPTECTIACTAYRWDPGRSPDGCVNGLVPIGRPFQGLDALVVDEDLAPVAPGSPGELCIAGPQTFSGYWRDPGATDAAFFTTAEPEGDQRYYRTGDRVRRLPSGDLAFLGRRDHQVKVLGHRVELGEVEAVLRSHPDVSEAVVLPVASEAGTTERLAAFVTGSGIVPTGLEAVARARLPSPAVPREFRVVETLPRNANGKVDRSALAEQLPNQPG